MINLILNFHLIFLFLLNFNKFLIISTNLLYITFNFINNSERNFIIFLDFLYLKGYLKLYSIKIINFHLLHFSIFNFIKKVHFHFYILIFILLIIIYLSTFKLIITLYPTHIIFILIHLFKSFIYQINTFFVHILTSFQNFHHHNHHHSSSLK